FDNRQALKVVVDFRG
ncbi:MAG: hypothetical protein QW668_05330, partial [Nitrososphaerota archaeon]